VLKLYGNQTFLNFQSILYGQVPEIVGNHRRTRQGGIQIEAEIFHFDGAQSLKNVP
jgi:hypothetical protein